MILLAFRHGNTFAPGAPVVCAGRQPGLPLVEAGWAQAEAAGAALRALGVRFAAPLHASPRLRARQFAARLQQAWTGEAVAEDAAQVEASLDEIDYGPWTGRTREEIARQCGQKTVRAWDHDGVWPARAGFGETEAEVCAAAHAYLTQLARSVSQRPLQVAVSHAGKLRYLAKQSPKAYAALCRQNALKLGCGHALVLRLAHGRAQLLAYNVAPDRLGALLPTCLEDAC